MERIVIVGAGQAGARAAQAAREAGFEGELLMLGAEEHVPYQRPPLTKDFLRGESEPHDLYVEPAGFYDQHHIRVVTGRRAERLDLERREVKLDGDGVVAFDRLLLATGARPIELPQFTDAPDGVFQLRTIEDSEVLRRKLHSDTRLLIAGGGWIGCEAAASAAQMGANVTMLVPEPFPLYRVLGPEVGAFFRDLHQRHGVEVLTGEGLAQVEGAAMVTGGVTTSGRRVACDALLLGVGVEPRVELARDAGIECDDGVLTSAGLETSAPGVFAAGDVARAWHPLYGKAIRVEHWFNADQQGLAAGRALAGQPVEYSEVPYFFSDQYDVSMEYSGLSGPDDRVVLRGDPADGQFTAVWIRAGRVVTAVLTVNSDSHEQLRGLVGGYLTPEQAADERHDLAAVNE